jgi:hypothetical protein
MKAGKKWETKKRSLAQNNNTTTNNNFKIQVHNEIYNDSDIG